VIQPIVHLPYSPFTQTISHQLGYEDTMRDHFKVFAKPKLHNFNCSSLFHRAIITDDYQEDQAQFAFCIPVLPVLSAAVPFSCFYLYRKRVCEYNDFERFGFVSSSCHD